MATSTVFDIEFLTIPIVSIIEDIVFKVLPLNYQEKANLSLVSKEKRNLYVSPDYIRIKSVYDTLKTTKRISMDDIKFINVKINEMIEGELDIFEGDEASQEYKDFCFDMINNKGFNMLHTMCILTSMINISEEDSSMYILANEGDYDAIAFEMCGKLERLDVVIVEPEINNVDDFISFCESLSFKQKNIIGL